MYSSDTSLCVCVCVCACTICAHVRVSRVAEAFEARKGLRGWQGGRGCMAPLQVGCDPLGVRVHFGVTGEDVCFEEMIYHDHLE